MSEVTEARDLQKVVKSGISNYWCTNAFIYRNSSLLWVSLRLCFPQCSPRQQEYRRRAPHHTVPYETCIALSPWPLTQSPALCPGTVPGPCLPRCPHSMSVYSFTRWMGSFCTLMFVWEIPKILSKWPASHAACLGAFAERISLETVLRSSWSLPSCKAALLLHLHEASLSLSCWWEELKMPLQTGKVAGRVGFLPD